ncbi:MAG: hypothetical protein COA78_30530 [Blastopirellula sp.]|nr:MAG: hypothetical protein COA78_30530 [Blastopirellula sp.]
MILMISVDCVSTILGEDQIALNLGYTQQDISTLQFDMIDWNTGIVIRDRHKTGVPTKAKLWESSLEILLKQMSPI